MNDQERQKTDTLSKKVIGYAYTVSNTLGSGFLEKEEENHLRLSAFIGG